MDDTKYVRETLELNFPKMYFEQFNTTFRCLGQILSKDFLTRDDFKSIVSTHFPDVTNACMKAFDYYKSPKWKTEKQMDYLSDDWFPGYGYI